MNRILQIASILIIASLIAVFVYVQSDSGGLNRSVGPVRVDVQEGSVHVSNPLGALDLKAGQQGIIAQGQKPALESLPDSTQTVRILVENDLHEPLSDAQVMVLDENNKVAFHALSDASGVMQLDLSPNFFGTLVAEATKHFAYKDVLIPNEPTLTVTLPRMLAIAGRVAASSEQSIDGFSLWLSAPSVTMAATQPEFVFAPLRPGEYLLQLRHPTLLGEDRTVQAGTNAGLVLQETGTLIVQMKTDQNLPVEGAILSLLAPNEGQFVSIAEIKTNEDGLASFTSLRKGQYRIAQRHSWLDRYQQTPVEMNRAVERLEIVVPQPVGVIAGRVIDASTGQPIPSAPVVLGLDQGRGIAGVRSKFFQSVVSTTETVMTDADGRFEFDHLWNGRYVVFVEHVKGYVSGNPFEFSLVGDASTKQVVINTNESQIKDLSIPLKHSWKISGVVYDQSGKPVADASVKALYKSVRADGAHIEYRNLSGIGAKAKTDDNGYYEIDGPTVISQQAGTGYCCQAFHLAYGVAEIPSATDVIIVSSGESKSGVDIHFAPSAKVYGTVRSTNGEPIAAAQVRVHPAVETTETPIDVSPAPIQVETDEEGHYGIDLYQTDLESIYRIDPRMPLLNNTRPYTLSASAQGFQSETRIEPGEWFIVNETKEAIRRDFALSPRGDKVLSGVVVDEQGKPLSGIEIHESYIISNSEGGKFKDDFVRMIKGFYQPVYSQKDGSFSIDVGFYPDLSRLPFFKETQCQFSLGILDSEYQLKSWEPEGVVPFYQKRKRSPNSQDRIWQTNLFPAGQQHIKLVLSGEPNATISGFVIDSNDNPIKNFDLLAVPSHLSVRQAGISPYLDWIPFMTEDGSFVVKELPKKFGPYVLVAKTDAFALGFSSYVAYPDLEVNVNRLSPPDDVKIRVGLGAQIWGTLVDANTQLPIANRVINSVINERFDGNMLSSRESYIPLHEFILDLMPSAVTDSTGRFVLKDIPTPSCNIRIPESNNYGEMLYALRALKPGEKRDVGVIQLKPKR